MASIKRVGTDKKTSAGKLEFTEALAATEVKGAKGRKSLLDDDRTNVESQYEQMGDTVWVHNISGTEYHVEPISKKTTDSDTAEIFQVNEVRPFDKGELNNKRFKKSLMDRKLKIVSEDEVSKIEKEAEKSKHRGSKVKVGVAESGLPVNKRAALNYIFDCDDIDELEGYQQLEDREFISDAIEQRIEELEGGSD